MQLAHPNLLKILGGALSAALFYCAIIPTFSGLSYFTLLPLFLVGLGLGNNPLYYAVALGTTLAFLFLGLPFGISFFVEMSIAPLVLVNRALLNREKRDKSVEWYPANLLFIWFYGLCLAFLIISFIPLWSVMHDPTALQTYSETLTQTIGGSIESVEVSNFFPRKLKFRS